MRFGSEEYGEEEYEAFIPDAEAFADFYFRVVAGSGDSLFVEQSARDVRAAFDTCSQM